MDLDLDPSSGLAVAPVESGSLELPASGGPAPTSGLEELACLELWLEEARIRAESELAELALGGDAVLEASEVDPFGWVLRWSSVFPFSWCALNRHPRCCTARGV